MLWVMVVVTFRVDERVLAAVDERARVERRGRSDVLRLAVESWVAGHEVAGHEVAAQPAAVEELRQRIATTASPVVQPHTSSAPALPAGWDTADPIDDIA